MSGSGGRGFGGLRVVAAVVALVLFAAGCGGDDGSPASEGASNGDPSEPAGEVDPDGVLRVGMNFFQNQQASLDPRVMSTSTNTEFLSKIYSTLAVFDPESGEYSPNLAEFEVLDEQAVQFTIRDDANFHDGRPVTSADAKASIEATRANTEAGTCNCNAGISLVESVEVVDEKTFVVHTSQPGLEAIFSLMVGPEFMISPADAGAEQSTNPIGNGPFRFVELVADTRLTLEKWDEWWDADEIQLGGMDFVHLDEGNPQLNALLAGDIDFAAELDFTGYSTASERDGFQAAAPVTGAQFMWFSMCKSDGHFYDDVRIRQAIMYAIDRDAINEALFGGLGEPSVQLWPAGHPYNDPELEEMYPHDPDRAAELLEEAGVAGTTQQVTVDDGSIAGSTDFLLLLNEMLSPVGLTLEAVPTDDIVGDFLRPAQDAPDTLQHDATINASTGRDGIQKLTRTAVPGGLLNPCNYDNPDIDQAVEGLYATAPDEPEAAELWHDAQRAIVDDAANIMFGFVPLYTGWSDNVGGVDPDRITSAVTGGYRFQDMYVTR
jgi:peptide/nickel transport system substrate-binding protein